MRLKRILLVTTIVIGGFLVLPQITSAHHPVLTATTDRPCGEDSSWSATVTATSDDDWDKVWRSRHRVDGGAYSAWSLWVDDQVEYGPIAINDIPASTLTITVTVTSEWESVSGGGFASATRSITVRQPGWFTCPTTTTTTVPVTTTTVPVTTTTAPVTTTTAPVTTTTAPVTTTTVEATTTTVEATTTTVESGGATTTTVLVGSNSPTTTLQLQLPKTGGDYSGTALALGALLLGLGAAALGATRRKAIS